MDQKNVMSQFASSMSEETKTITNEAIDDAPSIGSQFTSVNVAGTYLMKVRSFVMNRKDLDPKPFPGLQISETAKTKGALQLNMNLEVIDGTEAVPKGATIFYTLTLAQGPGATKEKIENTAKYMKPIVCALTGLEKFNFSPDFVTENLTIDYEGSKVTRQHKMTKDVMVVVEEYVDGKGSNAFRVKSIRAAKAGDKSMSIKQQIQETSSLDQTAHEIDKSKGEVIVESTALEYDPNMDTAPFTVEEA